MKVDIEVASWFKRFTSGELYITAEVPEGTSAVKAVGTAGIPEEEIGFITVNNEKVDGSYVLRDGDKLRVYPLIIGG